MSEYPQDIVEKKNVILTKSLIYWVIWSKMFSKILQLRPPLGLPKSGLISGMVLKAPYSSKIDILLSKKGLIN